MNLLLKVVIGAVLAVLFQGYELARTDHFYDGIRRIQEVVTDPVASLGFADMSGDPDLKAKAGETSTGGDDKGGTPLGFEEGQVGGTSPPVPFLEREYVWGPGDGRGGVDELLVQYDAQRKPWWVVQDEGGDVVALCDLGAANADGRVAAQFTYDAYGSPLSYDNLANHPLMHCGHKGLFVDRLDVGVAAGAGGSELPRITPFAQLLCHNRNRTYVPGMGRFLQADPNATAMVLLSASAMHGRGMDAIVAAFDMQDMYGDGANLYQYLGSNPWSRSDSTGLSWDPFEMVDDFIAEDIAQKQGTMEAAGQYWSQVGMMALTAVPVVGSFVSGYDMGRRLAMGKSLDLMDYVTLAAHALPLVGAMVEEGINVLGRAKAALERLRFQYAMRGTGGGRGVLGAHMQELRELGELGLMCFTCMSGDTIAWTPYGPKAVRDIVPGELVLTADQGPNVAVQETSYNSTGVIALWWELSAESFRVVHLRIERGNGSVTDIHQLMSSAELSALDLLGHDGDNCQLWMDDIGEAGGRARGGWAKVVSVGAPVSLGNGIGVPRLEAAPVTAVYVTTQATLLALRLVDSDKALFVTGTHPFWSEERNEWVQAMYLHAEDRIRTSGGSAVVESVDVARTNAVVHNLSVAGGHTFFIGDTKAWVHNNCGKVFSSYSEAVAITKGHGRAIQARHLVEARHFKNWEMPTNGPSVILTKAEHDAITAELRAALPYGTEYTRAQVRAAYGRIYANYPSEWWQAIRTHMGW